MCPRPEWAKTDPERWSAYQEARRNRLHAMSWYVRGLMDKGYTLKEAVEMLDHVMDNGYKPWEDPAWNYSTM